MAQQIILQKNDTLLQAAIVEDRRLAEYYLQQEGGSPASGSIYRGVVENILPGMQAAFVDIGWERTAYLALEDLVLPDDMQKANIGDVLKPGQSVVVQIKKEAVDTKGPRVTTELSLQGRTMVLLPGKYQVNISKKITSSEIRQQLKALADQVLSEQAQSSHGADAMPLGVIIRTMATQSSQSELKQEFTWLCDQWKTLQRAIQRVQKPGLIAADRGYAARIVRESARLDQLEGIYVNDPVLYEDLQQQILEREFRFKLHLREGDLLEQFQLSGEVRTIHKRKVLLPSGAELVIDRTEAMNVIDVNTARFTGKKELSDTILQTNLEATKEIACQIRLRNLSGIILVDFIDMKDPVHQQMVLDTMQDALRKDRVKTTLHGISHLGLVEITRQKVRAPLSEVLEEPCPMCHERGRITKQGW